MKNTYSFPTLLLNAQHIYRVWSMLLITFLFSTIVSASASLAPTTFTVTNENDSGAGSLRQAITDANNNPGPDIIEFNIPAGDAPFLIEPISNLPIITEALIIDGSSQPGFTGTAIVQINSNQNSWQLRADGAIGLTIQYLNLSRTTTSISGSGIEVTNSTDVNLNNLIIQYRRTGIQLTNNKDATVENNDLQQSGDNGTTRSALSISRPIPDDLPGGLLIRQNLFGGSLVKGGVYFNQVNNLIITDGNVGGLTPNIILEDNSGIDNCGNGNETVYGPLRLDNATNCTIQGLNLRSPNASIDRSFGIYVSNSTSGGGNFIIRDNDLGNRWRGLYIIQGRDYVVEDNNFTNSGINDPSPALYIQGVLSDNLPNGLQASGNLFGGTNANSGIYLIQMSDIKFSNAPAADVQFVIEDASGLNTLNTQSALRLDFCSNIVVDNIDVSKSTAGISGRGIAINNGTADGNISITNCTIQNRRTGIDIIGGVDYTITGNDLTTSGQDNNEPAIELNNVRGNLIPKGVTASNNAFGGTGTNTALRLIDMQDLIISDAAGADIQLEDNSGLNTINGNDQFTINIEDSRNIRVEDLDLSNTLGSQRGRGIYSLRSDNTIIIDNTVTNRRMGVWVSGGSDATVENNDVTGSGRGQNNTEPALRFENIREVNIPSGITASGNIFGLGNGESDTGVGVYNMNDLIISNTAAGGTHIILEDNSGLNNLRNESALYLSNCERTLVQNIDVSRPIASGATGQGITAINCDDIEIRDNIANNCRNGIVITNGSDVVVKDNDLRFSGDNSNRFALQISGVIPGILPKLIDVSGNLFGGGNNKANAGVLLSNMSDLLISNTTTGDPEVILEDNSGLNEVYANALYLNGVQDVEVQNLDLSHTVETSRQGTGLRINSSKRVNAHDLTINNRDIAYRADGSEDITLIDSDLTGSGDDNGSAAVRLSSSQANTIPGGILMSGNTFGGGTALMAFYLNNVNDIIISDGSIPGTSIRLESSSGLNDMNGISNTNDGLIRLDNCDDVTISTIDLSYPTANPNPGDATGIFLSDCDDITVDNVNFGYRRTGLSTNLGSDYTITNNSFLNSGISNSNPALYLRNAVEDDLVGGVNINNNQFGGTMNPEVAVRFENMRDLTITNGTPAGNVIFEDGTSGFEDIETTVLYLDDVSNVIVDNVDFTFAGTGQQGIAIFSDNNTNDATENMVFRNSTFVNRNSAIDVDEGTDVTIEDNTFENASGSVNNPVIKVESISEGSLPGGVSISGNTFTQSGSGVVELAARFTDMKNLVISDGTTPGTNVAFDNGFGDAEQALYFEVNSENISISDLSFMGSGSGTAVVITSGSSNFNISNCTIENYATGISQSSDASGINISCNTFTNNISQAIVPSNGTNIEYNNFINNNGMNAVFANAPNVVHVENNFWNDAAGPNMSGDGYSGTATFIQTTFLTTSSTCPISFPEISLRGNSILIFDGSTIPETANGTDVTGASLGNSTTQEFEIINEGSAPLSITGITLSGMHPGDFGLNTPLLPFTIPANSSETFELTFTPTATGLREAILAISNNDTDEATFDFAIQGTGNGPLVVTTTADSGAGSLREAFTMANANPGFDEITFNIPGAGVQTIVLSNSLPILTGPTIIDGSTQLDGSGNPSVAIRGFDNWYVQANDANVDSLYIGHLIFQGNNTNFNGYGILISNAQNVKIEENIFNNLRSAINATNIEDIQVLNNELSRVGDASSRTAITLNSIAAENLPGGIFISGNTFDASVRSDYGYSFIEMEDVIISDGSEPGTNVVQDNSINIMWLNPFRWSNCSNMKLVGLDLTYQPTNDRIGIGIDISNSNDTYGNYEIRGNTFTRRRRGVNISNGHDASITQNDFSDTGESTNEGCITLNGLAEVNLPGGIFIAQNTFNANTTFPFVILNMEDLVVTNGTVAGLTPNIIIEDGSGMNTIDRNVQSFRCTNCVDVIIEGVDFSRPTARLGAAVNFITSENILVQNNNIQNKRTGVFFDRCIDGRIFNNDLLGSGQDDNEAAIYIIDPIEDKISGGIRVVGNNLGDGGVGLILQNAENLIISNDTLSGQHIAIEDGELSTITFRGIVLNNTSRIRVDDVDLSYNTSRLGTGLYIVNSNFTFRSDTLINSTANFRRQGILVSGGSDVVIESNDFTDSGQDSDEGAISLQSVREFALPGGVKALNNTFGGPLLNTALYATNVRDLIISDGSIPNTNIQITGTNATDNGQPVIRLNAVEDVLVDNVDLSRPNIRGGEGVRVDGGSHNVTIQNIIAQRRNRGIFAQSSTDITILNNNVDFSGAGSTNGAISLDNLREDQIPGGILMNNNTIGNASTALYLNNLLDVTLSDGSNPNTNIFLPTASTDFGSFDGIVIYLSNNNNLTIDGLDVSRIGGRSGTGIYAENSSSSTLPADNNIIQNVISRNRTGGIRIRRGSDLQLLNNDVRESGDNITERSGIYIDRITSNQLPGGLFMDDNKFGGTGTRSGLYISNTSNLIISNGNVPNTNVNISNGDGLNQMESNTTDTRFAALSLNNASNIIIDSLDLSSTGTDQLGGGLYIRNSGTIGNYLINNINVRDKATAIDLSGGQDYTLTNNHLEDSDRGLVIGNIISGNIAGGIAGDNNQFGGDTRSGILFSSMTGLVIGNENVPDATFIIDPADSLTVTGNQGNSLNNDYAIYLENTTDFKLDGIDLSSTEDPQGYGLRVLNSVVTQGKMTAQNCIIDNRYAAMYIDGGSDHTISNNTFRNSGRNMNTGALDLRNMVAGNLTGGLSVTGNVFSGDEMESAIYVNDVCDVVVSDGSVANSSIEITPADSLQYHDGRVLYLGSTQGAEVRDVSLSYIGTPTAASMLSGGSNLNPDYRSSNGEFSAANGGPTRQGVGLEIDGGTTTVVDGLIVSNRATGMIFNGDGLSDYTIDCNTFYDNELGIDFNTQPLSISFENNHLECNATGLDADFTLNAQNNYWGAADGSATDGGSGDTYVETGTGTVDASNFLTTPPGCAPTPPTPEVSGNSITIADGDLVPETADLTDFGQVSINSTTTSTFTLTNVGDAPLRIPADPFLSISGDPAFTINSTIGDTCLDIGGSVDFEVTFNPTVVGEQDAIITGTNAFSCFTEDYTFRVIGRACPDILATLSGDQGTCADAMMADLTINITEGQAPYTVVVNDGTSDQTFTVNTAGTSTITVMTAGPTDVTFTLVSVTDDDGCTAASPTGTATIVFGADTTPPTITCPADISVNTDPGTCTVTGPSIGMATATDACSDVVDITITSDAPATFTMATTVVTYTAEDEAGNVASCMQTVTLVDNEAPEITCGIGGTATIYLEEFSTQGLGVGGGCGTTDPASCNTSNFTGADWTIGGNLPVAFADGGDFALTQADGRLLIQDANVEAHWQSPVIPTTPGSELTIRAVINYENLAATLNNYVDVRYSTDGGSTFQNVPTISGSDNVFTIDPGGSQILTGGANVVQGGIIATNNIILRIASLNSNTSRRVRLDDITVESEISGITVNNDPGECFATNVTLPSATATDNCSLAANITITNNAPASFPVGTPTTVTFTAEDEAGLTSSCDIMVEVVDNESPTASCNNITVELDASGAYTLTAADNTAIIASIMDNCSASGDIDIDLSPTTFDCDDIVDPTPTIWINEVHYDNTGGDTGEFIEIAGTAGYDLSGHSLVLYDGGDMEPYNTENLSGTIPGEFGSNGFGTLAFFISGIQNGAPDGIALVDDGGTVLEFISYEGVLTATAGPAMGMTSTDIGVAETGSTPVGFSLQLSGSGSQQSDFTWAGPAADSPGTTNSGQTFVAAATIVTVTAEDEAGNIGGCVAIVTVEDNTDPMITCPAAITVNTDPGMCSATNPVIGTATATDNCSDPGDITISDDAPTTFTAVTTTVTYTAEDEAGNTSTCTQIVTLADGEMPAITCPAAVTINTDPGECSATNPAIGDATAMDNCSDPVDITITDDAPTTFTAAMTTVTYTAEDEAGNMNTCTQIITLEDDEMPAISCPTAITVNTDLGVCTATNPVIGTATATDNCSDPGDITISDDAPTTFTAVTTTVTYTAEDEAGNINTCTQVVTLADNEMPAITCPPAVTVNTDLGVCSATSPAIGNASATDNCSDPMDISITDDAPTTFTAAMTTVTYSAEDEAGNVNTCTQVVTLADMEPPTLTCPGPMTVDLNADCELEIPDIAANVSANDNCTGVSVTQSPLATSLVMNLNDGDTQDVTITATDAAGNMNTMPCVVTLTVNNAATVSIADAPDASEGDSGTTNFTFTVTRTGSSCAFDLDFTTSDGTAMAGSDYAAQSSTLSFAAGEMSKDIVIQVNGDTDVEADETFNVVISNPTNGVTLTDDTAETTILNDDNPVVSIANATIVEGNAGTATLTFDVTLDQAGVSPVSVDFTTADGTATLANSDYQSNSGTINFLVGEVMKTVTVTVNGDTDVELDETLTVNLSSPSAGLTIGNGTATGTIENDDAAAVVIDAAGNSVIEGDAGVTPIALPVSVIGGPVAVDIIVNYSLIDGTATLADNDYADAASGSVTISANTTGVDIVANVIGDTNNEDNELFTVLITSIDAMGADVTLGNATAPANIIDDDFVCPTIGSLSGDTQTCIGETRTLTAAGLATMAEADNNGADYGIRFVYFNGPTADPYTGGTDLGTVSFNDLDGGGTSAVFDATFPNTPGNLTVYAVLSPIPAEPSCRPSQSLDVQVLGCGITNDDDNFPMISDPCVCKNNATTLSDGQFDELVEVLDAPAGETWTVAQISGLFASSSPAPPAAPLPIAIGTVLTEQPTATPGVSNYFITGVHVDDIGYSIMVSNGTTTLGISNRCWYPNPEFTNLAASYCRTNANVTLMGTAQLGDGSGSANADLETFIVIRLSDNSTVVNDVEGNAIIDIANLPAGRYRVIYTFDAADDDPDANHPGCSQSIEQEFEILEVSCGTFPWSGN